jgi:hypothetical protein
MSGQHPNDEPVKVTERRHLWTCQISAAREFPVMPRQLGVNAHPLGTKSGAAGDQQREQGMNPRCLQRGRKPAPAEYGSEGEHVDDAHVVEQEPAGNIR